MDIQIPNLDPSNPSAESDIYVVTQLSETATRKQTLTKLRQAIGANIVALFGLTGAADKLPWFTGPGAMALANFTPMARTLIDDTDAPSMRATLGVQNVSPGYIEGLNLQWASATAVTVGSGALYLNGNMVQVASPIVKTGIVTTASTFYHCYVFLNAGVPDVEFSTTAPSAAYFGTARNKTGDATRRYIGSFKSGATNTIIRFAHSGGRMSYLQDTTAAPLALVTNGQALTSTVVSTTGVTPPTATHLSLAFTTTGTGTAILAVSDPDMGNVTLTNALLTMAANATTAIDLVLPLVTVQGFNYIFSASPGSGGVYARAFGYLFER